MSSPRKSPEEGHHYGAIPQGRVEKDRRILASILAFRCSSTPGERVSNA